LPAPGTPRSLGSSQAIVIDAAASNVAQVSSTTANGAYRAGTTIPITVTFNEPVTVDTTGGTPALTLETGATDHAAIYASGSGTATLTFTYTLQLGDVSSDLDYVGATALALNGATMRDSAGNEANLALAAPGSTGSLGASKDLTIDNTPPTISNVTSTKADGVYKLGTVIPIAVAFTEAVTVAGGTPTLTLETGTIDRTATYATGSGTATLTFNYTVQAGDTSSDLDYLNTTALALGGATIRDAAGNDATLTLAAPGTSGSLGANKNLLLDSTAPAVSNVTSPTADGRYKAGTLIPVTVTFSKPVTVVTTNGTPTLTLETGSTNRAAAYSSGSGTATLTFNYTVQPGDVASDLEYTGTAALVPNGGTIRDAAGNDAVLTLAAPGSPGSLGANKGIIVDGAVPSVTINQAATQADPAIGSTIHFTVVFSEPVDDFATGDVPLSGTAGATTATVSGSGTTYDVAVAGMTADGTVIASVAPGAAHDAAGNASSASTSTDQTVTYDATAPTVASITPNLTKVTDANLGAGKFTLAVAFSEAMDTSVNPTITFPTAGEDPSGSPATLTFASGSWGADKRKYTAIYTIADRGLAMPNIDVAVTGGKDAAGNALEEESPVADVFDVDTLTPSARASLSGFVHLNAKNDGKDEVLNGKRVHPGVPGVTITLRRTDGAHPTRTTKTDSNGYYQFERLEAGTYQVVESQPAAFIDGKATVGTVAGKARGTAGRNRISNVVLGAGQTAVGYNFGEWSLQPRLISLRMFLSSAPPVERTIAQIQSAPAASQAAKAANVTAGPAERKAQAVDQVLSKVNAWKPQIPAAFLSAPTRRRFQGR